MKRSWKYVMSVILPLTGLSAILGACASMNTCNNDACYDRKVSSTDPYKSGDIAAWGTEREVAEKEERFQDLDRNPKFPGER
jgi:hypothetical protein